MSRFDSSDAQPPPAGREPLESSRLTSGSVLARNTLWTLAGHGAPLLAALVAIPPLIHRLGAERFGVLTLAWVLIGYFSLIDLGLGRALTQRIAERLGARREADLHREVATSLAVMFALGLVAGAALALFAPWLAGRALRIDPALREETLAAFRWIAVAIPFVVLTAGWAGILSAYQRFPVLNAIRIPTSLFSFMGPLIVVAFSQRIDHVVAVIVAGRIVGMVAHTAVTLRAVPWLSGPQPWSPASIIPLVRMGGWMTVSNLISPLMVQLDRFLVGAWLSVEAVTYYATPYEIATRLWIVPAPIVAVLFPAFATAYALDRTRAALLYERGLKYVWLILCPVAIAIVTLARDGMGLWLGPEFAARSTVVLQWMVVGTLANSIAQMPYALVQAAGRARTTALLHALELPVYLALVSVLMRWKGIEGAAWAWCARMVLDALLLLMIGARTLGSRRAATGIRRGLAIGIAGIAGAFAVQHLPAYVRIAYGGGALAVAGVFAWSRGMAEERAFLMSRVRTRMDGRDSGARGAVEDGW